MRLGAGQEVMATATGDAKLDAFSQPGSLVHRTSFAVQYSPVYLVQTNHRQKKGRTRHRELAGRLLLGNTDVQAEGH